ncbi:ribonuclease E activity regulator RraA [Deinococcus radiomollis]|uniref:ribonuclease E activity regulator RraA n=1 Tax=Deinococcus radiomollis TaxID=468916 RepID=UPI0038928213
MTASHSAPSHSAPSPATTDLSDQHPQVQIAEPVFRDFGGRTAFAGPAFTVRVFEDNTPVRAALETPGQGRVLVVDGGASLNCALLGDLLGTLAVQNGWAGVVVNGCVRDSVALQALPLGVKALAAHPRRSGKGSGGEQDISLMFAGVSVEPGDWIYADADGLLVSTGELSLSDAAQ